MSQIAIIFGRFNPPHKGHKAAWELASKYPHWYVGTNQSTIGPKDPLPYEVKVAAMTAIWPHVAKHVMGETSWLTLASHCYNAHPEAKELVCLTDEEWVTKTLVQYNGKQGAHGFYEFATIKQHPTPRLSSATALRDAVAKGDRHAFTQAAGISADTVVAGHPYFDLVAHYLNPYAEQAAAKKLNTKVPKEKAMAKGPAKQLAEAKKNNSIPASKPRNFVAKNATGSGAGAHKDKKKALKQGDVKHKNKDMAMSEGRLGRILDDMYMEKVTEAVTRTIKESKITDLNPVHDNSMRGVTRSRDVGGYDRVYHMNRLMMAMAMADGVSTKAVDSPAETWFEKYNTMHPLTQAEANMITSAMKTVPTDGAIVSPFAPSKEADDVSSVSPIAKVKRNRFGI